MRALEDRAERRRPGVVKTLLSHTMDNNFHTKSLRIIGPYCSHKSGKFFRRTVEFADGGYWWKPVPMHVQECIEEVGLARGKASTTRTNDTVKNPVKWRTICQKWSRTTSRCWPARCSTTALDDPAIQFEMAMVTSVCASQQLDQWQG